MRRLAAVLVVLATCIAPLGAQDKPQELPPPKPIEPAPVLIAPPVVYRVSRYQPWQNYAVDRSGFFRARVIDTSNGAYYYYDGKPYTTPTLRPWYWSTVVTGY